MLAYKRDVEEADKEAVTAATAGGEQTAAGGDSGESMGETTYSKLEAFVKGCYKPTAYCCQCLSNQASEEVEGKATAFSEDK